MLPYLLFPRLLMRGLLIIGAASYSVESENGYIKLEASEVPVSSTISSNITHHPRQHPRSNNPTIQRFPQHNLLISIPL
jgi:hypothetical protein